MTAIGIADKVTLDLVKGDTTDLLIGQQFIFAGLEAVLNYIQGISPIKSIQRGTLTIGNTDRSRTITISPVNMGKSMLNFLGAEAQSARDRVGSSADATYAVTGHHFVRINLESSSSIKASRLETGVEPSQNRPVTISWEVIEFN